MKEKILLIGGGGHCKSCIDVIETQGRYDIHGVIDLPEKIGTRVLSYPIIGSDSDLEAFIKDCENVLLTVGQIGSAEKRTVLFESIKKLGGVFPVIVSPKAYVSSHASIQEGTIVMHHASVNADAKIGRNCIINTGAIIEHDVIIEDYCHISTGAIVNGGVRVNRNSFFGSGAVSKEGITIEENSFIKAHCIVKAYHE
jgi:sugar O-acyltransferase (sialic acid O-acetyltransferase NeuD family)